MSKIYFASDFHLGIDARLTSRERERQILRWLETVASDAEMLYLVGDLFDFWFEYKSVVPKGFVRLLGKLGELIDNGLAIRIFTGNHDMWMGSYIEEELGVEVLRSPLLVEHGGKQFMIGHGDGLGPGDYGYKFIKKVFASKVSQWAYARLHPNFAFRMAQFWSGRSRMSAQVKDQWLGKDKEWLVQFAQEKIKTDPIDYFIFGHRHLPIICTLENQKSRYINLGDWLCYNSYAIFDGSDTTLKFFENENGRAIIV